MNIRNYQDISSIIMKPVAITKCEIGGDWYKNELEIKMIPNSHYPDYMDVQKWIMDNIDGQTLNIEDVVNLIYLYLMDNCKPCYLKVDDYIKGCKTHFDVIVTKESGMRKSHYKKLRSKNE